jgi:hypothetical protein
VRTHNAGHTCTLLSEAAYGSNGYKCVTRRHSFNVQKSQNQKTQIKSAGSSINVRTYKMSLQNMAVINVQTKEMGIQVMILTCAICVNIV